MKVAGIQHDIAWEDPAANFAHLAPLVADAAQQGAGLIALTEMFSYGFSMNTGEIAEPVDGPSTAFLMEQAAANDVWICGSLPEKSDGDPLPRNTLVLAGPGGETHRYAKKHRFAYGGEDEHYLAGDNNVTVEIDGVATSLFVCFDLRFAPEFWDGAPTTDLYVVIANWPEARRQHWLALLQARAIENQAYVLGVNRVGQGDNLTYSGDSRVFDPFGEALASADPSVETTVYANVDAEVVRTTRSSYPFLDER